VENWARSITFSARRFHRPTSIDELQEIVAAAEHVRALGAAHSFNAIADTPGDLVSLAEIPPGFAIDEGASTISFSGGVRLNELAVYLHAHGYGLQNLPSTLAFSVVGACATGTHGSGPHHAGLGSDVVALELVCADGELVTLSRSADGDRFCGAVVALGALGIVTRMTMKIVPTYDLCEHEFEDVPRPRSLAELEELFADGYCVDLFTDHQSPRFTEVRLKRLADAPSTVPPTWRGGRFAAAPHIGRQGVVGPWHERLPLAWELPTPGGSSQSEYFVPRSDALEAFAAVERHATRFRSLLKMSEIRSVAADDLWMSPCFGRDTLAIHFSWAEGVTQHTPALRGLLASLEGDLAHLAPRPHWGKIFTTPPEVISAIYPRSGDFRSLVTAFDPGGKFGNDVLRRVLGLP
jgi:xylitol oxidase